MTTPVRVAALMLRQSMLLSKPAATIRTDMWFWFRTRTNWWRRLRCTVHMANTGCSDRSIHLEILITLVFVILFLIRVYGGITWWVPGVFGVRKCPGVCWKAAANPHKSVTNVRSPECSLKCNVRASLLGKSNPHSLK